MSLRLLGFEGNRDEESPVNWGVAALADETSIVNAVTRRRTPLAHLEELVSDGHLSTVKGFDIKEEFQEEPLIVLELVRKDPAFPLLQPDTGKAGGLVQHRTGRDAFVYLFAGQESFDRYAAEVASKIVRECLYGAEWEDKAARDHVVRAGCILASHHAGINALRTAWLPPRFRERAKKLALLGLPTDAEREAFLEFLEAITASADEDYVIKYVDGIAHGGGLDVDHGEKILGSARQAHKPLAAEVVRLYPFLEEPPPPRFHYMKAASASFHFTAQVEGQPLGERVARRLELRMLERSLRGEKVIPDGARDELEKALQTLRSPDEDTTVSHVPIGGTEERLDDVSVSNRTRARRSEPFTVLGYQSGLVKLGDEVEVVLFPPVGKHHYNLLRLRTRDDGDGNEPLGARPMQEGDRSWLFQPLLLTLMRAIDNRGREHTHLRKVKLIAPGERGTFTAIPSSVVDGVVLHGFSMPFRRIGGDRFSCDIGAFGGLSHSTLKGAREWMNEFAAVCAQFELKPTTRSFKIWRPVKPPEPSAAQRILVALSEGDGALHQAELVDSVNRIFGENVRTNNTRREVLRNADLFAFDQSDARVVRMTEKGRLVAAALARASLRRNPRRPNT